jgi:hypothetical protein
LPFWWQSDQPEYYSDYILFTVPYKVTAISPVASNTIRIMITFVEEANITFMFSTINPVNLYTTASVSSQRTFDLAFDSIAVDKKFLPSPRVRTKITYLYDNVKLQPIFFKGWQNKEEYLDGVTAPIYAGIDKRNYVSPINNYIVIQSELFCSVQLTDGMWHQLATTNEGTQYATNFFERRMAVGVLEYWVDTTNRSTDSQSAWYDDAFNEWDLAKECFKRGDLVGTVKHVVSAAVSLIWNGLKEFLGWIYGVFVKVWDTLVKIGKFIKTVLTNFIDTIISIMGDIVGGIEQILNVAIYVISIIIFAFVVSWIGRLLYITKRGLNA